MASTTALFTGLSGLNAHSLRLDVIGNNISNVNTVGFKSSRAIFQNQFSQTFRLGSEPSGDLGGTNPFQVGLGVQVAATQRNFSDGTLTLTGDSRDLAIQGDGLFIVERAGQMFYSRSGAFRLDQADQMVGPAGEVLLGFGVDENFDVQPGALEPLAIPLGRLRIAEATDQVELAGNLDASGPAATTGGLTTLDATTGPSGFLALATGLPIVGGTLLTDIEDPESLTNPLFAAGQTIQLQGVQRGAQTLPTETLTITGATTVTDLLNFFNTALGIHSTATSNPDGTNPGASLTAGGVINIVGNTGTENDFDFEDGSVQLLDAGGAFVRNPFAATNVADADGESVRTTATAFDSLGNTILFDVAFVLESKNGGTGTTWRYDISSADNMTPTGSPLFISTGTVDFDTAGRVQTTTGISVSIGRDGSGAADPLDFQLFLDGTGGTVTALADQSELTSEQFGGIPAGVLEQFAVGEDGRVVGSFSNGELRTLGQVVLATFANNEGLVDEGGGLFGVGPNSGAPSLSNPGQFGAGTVSSGALELSNVDLGQEFIDLILTSTGYSASSRVIQAADELIQQLLIIGR